MINMFNLHSEKDRPNSWIWVSLRPHLIKKIYSSLLADFTQNEIAIRINKELNAGLITIVKHLIRIKKSAATLSLPLPLLIQLNKLSGKEHSYKLLDSIISLECKNYNSQSVSPVRKITPTLAKIIGAHVADGYLQQNKWNYAWKVTEGKKDLINSLATWIKEIFGFKTRVWYYTRDHMWVCSTKNKIFCRFLEKIVGLPKGKKSHTIREPDGIRANNLEIRNAFLSGILNFDGCVKTSGTVSLTSMSEDLIKSAKEIFDENEIKTNINYNKNKKSWIIETSLSRDITTHKKLLTFFEPNTYKHKRLKFFISDKKYPIKELNKLFPEERMSKISLNKVYEYAKKLNKFKITDLAQNISSDISKTTLYKYLHILTKSQILLPVNQQITTHRNVYSETIYNFVK